MKAFFVMAALLAYIPSPASLLKRAAGRTMSLGKTREVTLSGTLSVRAEATRPAQLVLRFPLSCKLEGDGGLSLSVHGTPDRPAGTAEGTTGPALQLLQLACPFLTYRGLPPDAAEGALRAAVVASGADMTAASALGRFGDRFVYVLGAGARDLTRPQLWIYKDNNAPARLLAQGGADLRLLEYGSPAAADYFPRVMELWLSGQPGARFEVLETKGAKGAGEEEEDDSRE
ncbi:MAG: hypothetical protein ABR567_13790 [Myxococcales bacterium]|nr:hypothetical protein [Myxococcales bacterium]